MIELRRLHGTSDAPLQPTLTLPIHNRFVHAVLIMPDGDSLVSSSEDGTLKVTSLATGELLRLLEGHSGPVNSVALTPDGTQLITGGDDYTVRIWSVATWETLHVCKGHEGYVRNVATNNRIAVSGAEDHKVRFWNLSTGECIRVAEGHTTNLRAVAASADGKYAASAALENSLRLWNIQTGEAVHTLYDAGAFVHHLTSGLYFASENTTDKGHRETPACLLFAQEKNALISIGHELIVWDITTGEERSRSTYSGWEFSAAALHPDGNLLVLCGRGATLWDLEANRALSTFDCGGTAIRSTSFSRDGKHIVTGDDKGVVRVWSLEKALRASVSDHNDSINNLAVVGDRCITGGTDGSVILWDLTEGTQVRELGVERCANGNPFALSASGLVCVTANQKSLDLWNARNGLHITRSDVAPSSSSYTPHGFGFSGDQQLVVGWSGDSLSTTHDLQQPTFTTLKGSTRQVSQVVVMPDGKTAVTCGYFEHSDPDSKKRKSKKTHAATTNVSQLQGWDLQKNKLLWTHGSSLMGGEKSWEYFSIFSLVPVSHDVLVTQCPTRSAALTFWHAPTGEILAEIDLEHSDFAIQRVVENRWLLGMSWSNETKQIAVRIDLQKGHVFESVVLDGNLWQAVFSDNGELIATTSDDTFRILDAHTGATLAEQHLGSRARNCAFGVSDTRVVIGDEAGRVHIFALNPRVSLTSTGDNVVTPFWQSVPQKKKAEPKKKPSAKPKTKTKADKKKPSAKPKTKTKADKKKPKTARTKIKTKSTTKPKANETKAKAKTKKKTKEKAKSKPKATPKRKR
jgi:WD40 repeat protein